MTDIDESLNRLINAVRDELDQRTRLIMSLQGTLRKATGRAEAMEFALAQTRMALESAMDKDGCLCLFSRCPIHGESTGTLARIHAITRSLLIEDEGDVREPDGYRLEGGRMIPTDR